MGASVDTDDYLRWVEWYPRVIASTCSFYERCVYIEIGVDRGFSIRIIAPNCAEVHAVDIQELSGDCLPAEVTFWHMTSDAFFEAYDGSPPNVVFIDGDHTHHQAARDFANTIAILSVGGIVFLHDTWPTAEEHLRSNACGTVWLLAEEIAARPDLESFTWPGFPGLTAVRRRGEGRDLSQFRSTTR
jgi:hypothetical protein